MERVKSAARREFEGDALPHLESLWRTALCLTGQHHSAENLVLKTMARAYRSWHDSTTTAGVKARLFKVLAGEFSNNGNRGPESGRSFSKGGVTSPGARAGAQSYPITSIDRRDLGPLTGMSDASIRGAISGLGAESRLILILMFCERFSYADIAYITGLKAGTVRPALSRLRRMLPGYLLQNADRQVTAGIGDYSARSGSPPPEDDSQRG